MTLGIIWHPVRCHFISHLIKSKLGQQNGLLCAYHTQCLNFKPSRSGCRSGMIIVLNLKFHERKGRAHLAYKMKEMKRDERRTHGVLPAVKQSVRRENHLSAQYLWPWVPWRSLSTYKSYITCEEKQTNNGYIHTIYKTLNFFTETFCNKNGPYRVY